jgi:glycosyltransferase involved in cell wall biosynthesis
MSLTICMVVYNEEKNLSIIEHNLCLLNRVAPQFHCLLIDNASDEGSTGALHQLSTKYGVRFVVRSENHLPQARQQALLIAETQWVGFIDADCRIDEAWVSHVIKELSMPKEVVVGFGGPWIIVGDAAPIYQGLFRTFLGHFGLCYLAGPSKAQFVPHLPTANIIYHRQKVLSVGGFSSLHPQVGEDLDLSHRLQEHGFLLEYKPNLKIQHRLPVAFKDWCRKMFLYGTARGEVLSRYNSFNSYREVLPVLFLLTALSTVLIGLLVSKFLCLVLVSVYLLFCMSCSFERQRMSLCAPIALRMMATHVFYALGVFYGCSNQMPSVLKKKFAQWHCKDSAWENKSA